MRRDRNPYGTPKIISATLLESEVNVSALLVAEEVRSRARIVALFVCSGLAMVRFITGCFSRHFGGVVDMVCSAADCKSVPAW